MCDVLKCSKVIDQKKIHRLILCLVEEAGEENVGTIINSVQQCIGSPDEVQQITIALNNLLLDDFVELARLRDKETLRWIPFCKAEAELVLSSLNPWFQWDQTIDIWKWRDDNQPRIQVLLTDKGFAAAREILSLDGWPF
jgi:hypothetical protein